MLELMLCSILTILPDYLYRRFAQHKRFGKEITIYNVFFELRYGITGCLILTVLLITTVFYNHPSTTNVVSFFRTVPILPETSGRVAEIYVGVSDRVEAGAPIFRLDNTKQVAALEAARAKVAEVDAQMVAARADIATAEGKTQEAEAALKQAQDELATKEELNRNGADIVARREIERLRVVVTGRTGSLKAANANQEAAELRLSTLLPAEKASAEAAREQAQVELNKTTVYAGVPGRVEQFTLRVGDIVNPLMRPAGLLIPSSAGRSMVAGAQVTSSDAGRATVAAGFAQIEAQVIKVGMIAELVCAAKPFAVVPMVVVQVQDYIASGQLRAADQLIDVSQQAARPGTILAYMTPLYDGGLDNLPLGSTCIANAYTSNHALIESKDTGGLKKFVLHAVDALGLVHAMILRIQALFLPFKALVFSGGH